MEQHSNSSTDAPALARVVALDAGHAWLEPLQTGSCGSCASAALCGTKGIGSLSNRLEARRFAVSDIAGLRVGDTVEVAFAERNLIKGAAIAYAIPLLSALVLAALVQARVGSDGWTMLGALGGMAGGFALMKVMAGRLEARGALNARIVRRNLQSVQLFPSGASCDA